ncbi:MAG: glycosyltransferase [Betaproteobacteria bacterium]|nr:glycosyltransferase [Betaproteobacteria bacterium]
MLTIGLVGPLPPPAGGMAMQCRQLEQLLSGEGMGVRMVQTNAPYRPWWIGRIRLVRAAFRLLPYLGALWRMTAEVQVVHVLANSGWAWHLFAAPAVWIARWRGVPVVVNYRGGDAAKFLRGAARAVKRTLLAADARVAPSGYLRDVFAREGIDMQVIANVVDLDQFRPNPERRASGRIHVIVTRNLEALYDIDTALKAFALLGERVRGGVLTIAGEGPERLRLAKLAAELGIGEQVDFAGRLDRNAMAALYRDATVMLNPSTVDNMPNVILEAYAAGVPVVSTDVGGIPYIARDGETALLVPARNPEAIAKAVCAILDDPALADRLIEQGLREAQRYAWSEIRGLWLGLYESLASQRIVAVAEGR